MQAAPALRPGEPIDLGNCDREPIHIPGSIQPHGALLAVTRGGLVVAQASTNTGDLLGVAHEALTGAPLATLLDAASLGAIEAVAGSPSLLASQALTVEIDGRAFELCAHRASGLVVIELEPSAGDAAARALFERTRAAIEHIQLAPRLAEVWPVLATEVRAITGYDRVMIYRFAAGGAGEVIAEARREDVEGFLGLWFPASDVPQQARALYVRSRVRHIVDAAYVPVPIVPALSPVTGEPLDLGRAHLRSVSPIHCRYLGNMGVRGSMSISLVHEGRLWGLIACHHLTPRFVPHLPRLLAALVGDVAAAILAPKLEAEHAGARLHAASVQSRLAHAMITRPDLVAALVAGQPSALDLVRARGLAVSYDGAVALAGVTPDPEEMRALVAWLLAHRNGATYATDALASDYPPAAAWSDTASGLLAVVVSKAHGMIVVWLRPEHVREVRWAGDPHKPVDVVSGELSPRRSFALWSETVRGRSQLWEPWEIEVAEELGATIAGVVLEKAAEVERLNVDLKRAVQSRDELVSMASHELRTPTTTLSLQLEAILHLAEADRLPPAGLRARVGKALLQVERIEKLIRELLDVSRISAGRLDLERSTFELAELAREVVERRADARLVLTTSGDTSGHWDHFRVDQVLTNLLTNALKYGEGKPVEIDVHGEGDRVMMAVRDHGIGISAEARARIFDRFERAVSSQHFAGFGLGLWIARRIVDEHGGRIAVESTPGEGSTFTVELPR